MKGGASHTRLTALSTLPPLSLSLTIFMAASAETLQWLKNFTLQRRQRGRGEVREREGRSMCSAEVEWRWSGADSASHGLAFLCAPMASAS